MLNMAFCEVMMEGDAKGRTFSFHTHIQHHGRLELNSPCSIKSWL